MLVRLVRRTLAGGRVYAFGGNACGQLGLGQLQVGVPVNTPRLVKLLQVRSFSRNDTHNLRSFQPVSFTAHA